jgi:hypothetical protein
MGVSMFQDLKSTPHKVVHHGLVREIATAKDDAKTAQAGTDLGQGAKASIPRARQ